MTLAAGACWLPELSLAATAGIHRERRSSEKACFATSIGKWRHYAKRLENLQQALNLATPH
jgi:hypothetical protein